MATYHLYSWNVNGIRAVARKGFLDWLAKESPQVLCLQETKASVDQLEDTLVNPSGYTAYFSSAIKKGYSGTATYTQTTPESVSYTLSDTRFNDEGRIVRTDFPEFVLFNVYFPNGKASAERLQFKMDFYQNFLNDIQKLRSEGKRVVICGDVNTAHTEIDLARPKQNEKTSGFLPQERAWLDNLVEAGFIDAFREFNQEPDNYTWWSQRGGARARNVGWRIDYFFVSDDLKEALKSAQHHTDVMGSDHCPISITLEF